MQAQEEEESYGKQNSEALGGDPGPAASATPGSLLEMQKVRLHPRPAQAVSILATLPGDSLHVQV